MKTNEEEEEEVTLILKPKRIDLELHSLLAAIHIVTSLLVAPFRTVIQASNELTEL